MLAMELPQVEVLPIFFMSAHTHPFFFMLDATWVHYCAMVHSLPQFEEIVLNKFQHGQGTFQKRALETIHLNAPLSFHKR